MRATGLLIASLILAALLGLLYWSNHAKQTGEASPKTAPDAPPKILSLNQADVIRLTIRHRDQPPIDLSRSGSGAWQITAPKALSADPDAVSGVLSTASPLASDRLLEPKITDLAPYGLAHPELELGFTSKDNKTQTLLVGDQTPAGNAYYVALAGDPRLFTLAGYNKSSLDKSINDLRDKRLLTADFDKVSQVQLTGHKSGKTETIVLAREKEAWQVLKPGPWRADSEQAEELIRTLREAKMDVAEAADDSKAASLFASAKPFAAASVAGTSGKQDLEVRKAKDDYYARSSVLPGAYRIPTATATGLEKGLDDLRNKKLFDFGYQEPEKIEMHDGPKAYFFTRAGADWWGPDGKKLDGQGVESLIEKLRGLAAVRFPEAGFTALQLALTVISDGGKRTERVSIAKHGEAYLAKRIDEPALYELPASAVQDLQDAAAKVKPAAAPK